MGKKGKEKVRIRHGEPEARRISTHNLIFIPVNKIARKQSERPSLRTRLLAGGSSGAERGTVGWFRPSLGRRFEFAIIYLFPAMHA